MPLQRDKEGSVAPRHRSRRFAVAIALAIATAVCAPHAARASLVPWKLERYTLVARDMDLRLALDTFATAEGISLIMSPNVMGNFSGDFKDVPSGEFLERLATMHNLTWYYDGAALYVYGSGEVQTYLLDLAYMKAGEVHTMLADLGVEDERFPIKKTSDDAIIMVSGPPRYVALVAELVAKADRLREKRTHNEVEMRLFPLKNTWADNVSFNVSTPESSVTIKGIAQLLSDMMTSTTDSSIREAGLATNLPPDSIEAAMASTFRPVIKPENRLNAVMVRDVAQKMPMYEKLISQLDVPQKLVEIDVTVVELSKKDSLDWQLSLKAAHAKDKFSGAAGQNAGSLFDEEGLAGNGLAGALSYLGSEVKVSASLTALREKGKARSISRTSLVTMNNLGAQMTDSQSYHVRVVGTEVASLEEVSAGTKLQVKPRIVMAPSTNVANQVWLTLGLDDGGFESISVDSMPMTRTSSLQTQTAVFENEAIMLAGYLRDIEESAGWGIPYLRDIPFIGWLFGGTSTHKETVQRMFILVPHIVDLDTEMLARLQATRLRDITHEEQIEDDLEESDALRRKRDMEREFERERREERDADAFKRRKAELKHAKAMRKIWRKGEVRLLSEDIKAWEEEEEETEEKAALMALVSEEAQTKEKAAKDEKPKAK